MTIATKESISEILFEAKAYTKKSETLTQEQITNQFLDKILSFKQTVIRRVEAFQEINEKLEAISWSEPADQEAAEMLNTLINYILDSRPNLQRQYATYAFVRSKGIAKDEINAFKLAIDDLHEIGLDLYSTFISLPKNKEFQRVNQQLADL